MKLEKSRTWFSSLRFKIWLETVWNLQEKHDVPRLVESSLDLRIMFHLHPYVCNVKYYLIVPKSVKNYERIKYVHAVSLIIDNML